MWCHQLLPDATFIHQWAFGGCSPCPPGEGNGIPLQYFCLENPMDGGAWWAAVHGVAKSWTQLSDFTFTFHFHALGKEMATHSSVLAWRIPGTGEPGGLPSMGSHSVGHDWSDLAAAAPSPPIYADWRGRTHLLFLRTGELSSGVQLWTAGKLQCSCQPLALWWPRSRNFYIFC